MVQLPTPSEISVHQLRDRALRQWWQISRPRPDDQYMNVGIRASVPFLACLPLGSILLYYIGGAKALTTICLCSLAWLGMFVLFLSHARRQLYNVLQVQVSEEGLEFRSLFFTRKIRWLDIVDFFPAGNTEVVQNEFALDCRSGEQFLLSKDLTDSAKLFDLINLRIPRPTVSYELTAQVRPRFSRKTIVTISIFIIVYEIVITIFPVVNLAILILLLGFSPFLFWLLATKMPYLMRSGRSGIYIRTPYQCKVIPWDQITNITQIGLWLLVKSHLGWFLVFADKKEPMTEKLLECKRNLPTLNRMRH